MKCNALENLHAVHESMALPVLSALADENLEVLEDKQHMVNFMMFLGHQFSRTKSFRDGVSRAQPRRSPLEAEFADLMSHSWWFVSFMLGMNVGFSLFADRHQTTHALLINNTETPFITSDQPVINVHPEVSETEFVAPKNADFYYPISPRIAYMICESGRYKPGRNTVDDTLAAELNVKVASQAIVHIVGNSEGAIRPFKKYVGRRHKKAPHLGTSSPADSA